MKPGQRRVSEVVFWDPLQPHRNRAAVGASTQPVQHVDRRVLKEFLSIYCVRVWCVSRRMAVRRQRHGKEELSASRLGFIRAPRTPCSLRCVPRVISRSGEERALFFALSSSTLQSNKCDVGYRHRRRKNLLVFFSPLYVP